ANFSDLTVTTAGVSPGLVFGDNVSKWNFAWALHAGLAYRVSPNFTVELAYRYLDMGNGLTGDLRSPDGTNTIVNPTTFKSLTSHDVKMGVRWQLDSPPAEVPPLRRG
ncbi:MAG TPA: porin family protein, partial [Bradyrhizobium sp.]|nr:porin family protein [Bradyrhizobium sp.]